MNRPQCIITGCYLTHRHRTIYGDLHAHEGMWIFNAVLSKDGDALEHDEPPASTQRILQIYDHCSVFERRGVVVVPLSAGRLNPAAQDYLSARPA